MEGGNAIIIDIRQPIGDDVLRTYLQGVLMATLLRQRGLLVLHACCVARDGKAFGFVGESGWGKSTLAEYFCQQGYELLNDDVMAIEATAKPHPLVVPGAPQIRLRPQAGEWLRDDFDNLPKVHSRAHKRVNFQQSYAAAPVPLSKLYMLDRAYTDRLAIEPLSKKEALLPLMQHTRVTHLFKDPTYTAQHLNQCSSLVNTIPVARLHRVRDLETLPKLQALVEQDLADTSGTP